MDSYIDLLGMDYLFPIYTDKCIDLLGTYPVDLSISETKLQQTSSGLGLLPLLLRRHLGYAHDQQLHLLQLPPLCSWFLLDWPETYYYLVHQHDPEDWIRVERILFLRFSM